MAGLRVYASRLDTHTYSVLTTFSATQGDGAVISKGVDRYGTGGHVPFNIWTAVTLSRVFPNIWGVK